MRGLAPALALVLALAGHAGAVAFGDPVGDVVQADGSSIDQPSADIILVTGEINGSRVEERVTVAGHPSAPEDLILARTWYQANASAVVDLKVDGGAPNVEDRFTGPLNATYGLENDTWVFSFPTSAMPNATCFQFAAFTRHSPHRGNAGADEAWSATDRACLGDQDPPDPLPTPRHVGIVLSPAAPAIPLESPGSKTPRLIPIPATLGLLAIPLAAAIVRRRG